MLTLIPWVGGKTSIADRIIAMMPPHETYIEVFGGGGSVLLNKTLSPVEVYNDLNGDLVNLFRVVRERCDEFIAAQEWLLSSREEYNRLRTLHKNDAGGAI